MSKLNMGRLIECNNSTRELQGIFLGCKTDKQNKPAFIDFNDSNLANKNLHIFIIGNLGPGQGFNLNKLENKVTISNNNF